MKRTALLLAFLALPTSVDAQVSAQRALTRGTWLLTGELGGAAFTAFQSGRAMAAQRTGTAVSVQRRVSASTTATLGASIGYWAATNWGLRAAMSFSPSNFTVADAESAEPVGEGEDSDAREGYASLAVWAADLTMLFRFPRTFGRVQPYGIVGGGVVRYTHGDDAELPAEARAPFEHGDRTHGAAVFGFGALIPLQRHDLMLSFELTDHLSRSPLGGEPGDTPDVTGAAEQGSAPFTNQLRLVVGLTLPLR